MTLPNRTRQKRQRIIRFLFTSALAFMLALTTFSLAFGDFVPVTEGKVLGVGRIQSTIPEVPVAPEAKFALATSPEVLAEQASELNEPIAREVAALPGFEILPPPAYSAHSGWVTSIATNYGTEVDQFLNQMTANGDYTTSTSMGVANKQLPLGTILELYCPQSDLSCFVVVNDRGPYGAPGSNAGRLDAFDLQMGVTWALGENYGWYTIQYRIVGQDNTLKAENVPQSGW